MMELTREIEKEVLKMFYKHHDKCFKDGEINDYLDTKYPPQLPKKGWLKCNNNAIAYRTGKRSGYGINSFGEWQVDNWSFISNSKAWRPATREEVEDALINFAREQGYKNGNYKCLDEYGHTHKVNKDSFFMYLSFDVWHGEENGGHNLVFRFNTGEWAEIIEDENKELKEQIEKLEKQLNELKARL